MRSRVLGLGSGLYIYIYMGEGRGYIYRAGERWDGACVRASARECT